jgi:predicted unusual protein kinase regulating ubiquinone biosynthesis (AarF/ABC1/UbiB family)
VDKVPYPGVAEAIAADLANVEMLYALLAPLYPAVDRESVIDELRGRILEELDYRREAHNQRRFAAIYDGHPYIRIPRVYDELSTARVLTSELIRGRRFESVVKSSPEERTRYGEIIFRFVFGSIARHGLFNGDPHPGNYLFDNDGRVAFLDFGCVKEFPAPMLANWRKLVTAHLEGERQRFAQQLVALDFIPSLDKYDRDLLFDYFGYFYEPIQEDRPFTFDRDYTRRSFGVVFRPEGKFAPLSKQLNMPRDFVFVNRIQWGVHSILAQLGATANWHRIHRELIRGEAPATELGRIDAAWARAQDQGVPGQGMKRQTLIA